MKIFRKIHYAWQWFYENEHTQFILWAPVFLGIGISYYFADVPVIPFKLSLLILVLVTLLSLGFRYLCFIYRPILYAVNLVSLGYCLISYVSTSKQTPFIDQNYKKIYIEGVLDHIESRPSDWRITLKDVRFINQETPPLAKVRLVHKIKQPEIIHLMLGDRVKALVSLNPPKPAAFAGAYDFRLHAYFNQYSASGFTHTLIEKQSTAATAFWQRHRHNLTQFFEHTLTKPQGAIASALVTGERSGIPNQLRNQYADAGIAHILAISGLHVSVVAAIVFFIFRKMLSLWFYVALRYEIKKLAAGMAIIFTFCYMQLSGASYPAIRSFIMITLILSGIIIDRPAVTLRNCALAALIILIIIPQALISASFQLSFSAVIGLVAMYEKIRTTRWAMKIALENKTLQVGLNYFFGLAFSSLIATAATTPYTIFTFHRFTLVAIVSNLIAVPLISFIIMPILLLYLFLALFSLSHFTAPLLNISLQAMNMIAVYCSALPFAHLKVRFFSSVSLGIMTIGLLWILLWKTWIKWLGIIFIILAIIKIYYFEPLPDLFINNRKNLICYYDGYRGYVTSRQCARFDRNLWQDAYALTSVEKNLPKTIQKGLDSIVEENTFNTGILIWLPYNKIQPVYTYLRPWNYGLCPK